MSTGTEDSNEASPRNGRHRSKTSGGITDLTATVVIYVVTGVWVVNVLAGMFEINGYEPDKAIHGIFMTIVGSAFVVRARTKGE